MPTLISIIFISALFSGLCLVYHIIKRYGTVHRSALYGPAWWSWRQMQLSKIGPMEASSNSRLPLSAAESAAVTMSIGKEAWLNINMSMEGIIFKADF